MSTFLYDFTWDGDCLQAVWCGLDGVESCVEAVTFHPGDSAGVDWHETAEHLGVYVLASEIKLEPGDGIVVSGLGHGEPIYGSEARAQLQRLQKIEEHGTHIPSEAHIEQEQT